MSRIKDRSADIATATLRHGPARPVVLGTLSVRPDPTAEEMAVSSALEAGVILAIANVVRLPPYPAATMLGGPGAAVLPHEEDLDAVRATANRAAALGIPTKHLRIATKRPVNALLEVVSDLDAGLLVFGPDLALVKRRTFRKAAAQLRRDARCLVWVAPDG